jgi:hypothetical protein
VRPLHAKPSPGMTWLVAGRIPDPHEYPSIAHWIFMRLHLFVCGL